jgi:hypothetical protein
VRRSGERGDASSKLDVSEVAMLTAYRYFAKKKRMSAIPSAKTKP